MTGPLTVPGLHPCVAALQARLLDTCRTVLGDATDCALLDFPDHANVGDSAIWLGQVALLDRAGIRIRYAATRTDFSLSALRRHLPAGGIVLIHGGGNFGTLYPAHQEHREALLRDLRDLRVVQLPQSICYDDEAALQASARALAAHPRFSLMVRDSASQHIASQGLAVPASLCPDSALMLAGMLPRVTPRVDCLVLAREDKERTDDDVAAAVLRHAEGLTVSCGDWPDEDAAPRRVVSARWLRGRLRRVPWRAPAWQRLATTTGYTMAAQARVQQGMQWLGQGRVIITDRLHGMILAVAAGIPCVALDNRNGKVAAFHRLWFAELPGCVLAASPAKAVALARRFIEDAGLVPASDSGPAAGLP